MTAVRKRRIGKSYEGETVPGTGYYWCQNESEENLKARYAIILKQRDAAYKRLDEAKATAKYMDDKVAHYEAILAGLAPDDTNPKNWTNQTRPRHEKD